MRKLSVLSLTLLALSIHATAQAQEHRLAFSQTQQVEVFVDQASEDNWCKEELALRFAFDLEQANIAAVENLLPKLGVLFSQQCAAAERVTWQALNKEKTVQATGTANKQAAWLISQDQDESTQQMAEVESEAAPAEVAAVETSTVEPEAQQAQQAQSESSTEIATKNVEKTVAQLSAKATEATEATEQAAVVAAETQTEKVSAKATKHSEVEPKVAAIEKAAKEEQTEVVVSKGVQATAEKTTLAEQPAPEVNAEIETEESAPRSVAKMKSAPLQAFTVNGWQPKAPNDFLATHKSLRTLVDQQGCKVFLRSDADLGQQEYTVTSSGASCENGFLNGKGSLAVTRSDGALIVGYDAFFKHGLPLHTDIQFPLVDMDEGGNAYVLLEKDVANQFYYLLKVNKNRDGRWRLDTGTVYLLTETKDTFRQAELIKSAVLAPVSTLTKSFSRTSRYNLLAVTDFTAGIVNRKGENWLYQASVSKPWRSNEWRFDPNNATNYLFRNEAREAQEAQRQTERKAYQARLELEKLARQASTELETYKSYQKQHRDLAKLVQSKLTDVEYSKIGFSQYHYLLKGQKLNFSQIVNITSEKKHVFWADYPYQLAIDALDADVELSKGWYLVSGKQQLDLEQKDNEDLPLTVVYPTYTFACKEKGCTDFFTPLNLTRLEFSKTNWTPEAAEQQIADAQKVQK